MTDNRKEYRREYRRDRNKQPRRRSFLTRLAVQTLCSLLIFAAVLALNTYKSTASTAVIGFIKTTLEYKIDTAEISSFASKIAEGIASGIASVSAKP